MRVFCSYCHEDEKYKERLKKHFAMMLKKREIEFWDDRELVAGQTLDDEIIGQLERADVVIALISADYLNSNYCYEVELGRAMERHDLGLAVVAPVLLHPCDWKEAAFAKGLVCPRDAKPVSLWDNEDEALLDAETSIKAAILKLEQKRRAGGPAPAITTPAGSLEAAFEAAIRRVEAGGYADALALLAQAFGRAGGPQDKGAANQCAARLSRAIAARESGTVGGAIPADKTEAMALALQAYNDGNKHREKADYAEAIALFSKSIGLDPENANAYAARGDCYRITRQYDLALNDIKKALEPKRILNNRAWTLCVLGNIYMDMGKQEDAFGQYEQALIINPFYTNAYINLSNGFTKLGKNPNVIDMDNVLALLKGGAAAITKVNLKNYFASFKRTASSVQLYGYVQQEDYFYRLLYVDSGRLHIDFGFKEDRGILFFNGSAGEPKMELAYQPVDSKREYLCGAEPLKLYRVNSGGTGFSALTGKLDEYAKNTWISQSPVGEQVRNFNKAPDGKYLASFQIPVWIPGQIDDSGYIYVEQIPFEVEQGNVKPVFWQMTE